MMDIPAMFDDGAYSTEYPSKSQYCPWHLPSYPHNILTNYWLFDWISQSFPNSKLHYAPIIDIIVDFYGLSRVFP